MVVQNALQTIQHASLVDLAQEYVGNGWRVIPVPYMSKAPTINDWPNLQITLDNLDHHFSGGQMNIGVVLGQASGNLIDVDVDDDLALKLAPRLLPPTNCIFGRKSRPRSHWLYYAQPIQGTSKLVGPGRMMLVEIRGDGQQTIFPGSVHPSGEAIEFDDSGDPGHSDPTELQAAVTKRT